MNSDKLSLKYQYSHQLFLECNILLRFMNSNTFLELGFQMSENIEFIQKTLFVIFPHKKSTNAFWIISNDSVCIFYIQFLIFLCLGNSSLHLNGKESLTCCSFFWLILNELFLNLCRWTDFQHWWNLVHRYSRGIQLSCLIFQCLQYPNCII